MQVIAKWICTIACVLLISPSAFSASATGGDTIQIQDMTLTIPPDWTLTQDAKDDGTILLGFANGPRYITLYVKHLTGINMRQMFVNGSQVVRDIRPESYNQRPWNILETSRAVSGSTTYVAAFLTELNGYSYYGYSRGSSSADAIGITSTFLTALK